MKGDASSSECRSIDYRNGKYQGFINNNNRRHEMGLVIDDDLNIYFSEWSEGQLNGLTFIYLNDGTFMYGRWKNNQPSGINFYRNKEFMLVASYFKGESVGEAIAITQSLNHFIVFDGNQIRKKNQTSQIQVYSFQNIIEINYFESILLNCCHKNNLKIEADEISVRMFLVQIAKKYERQLIWLEDDKSCFFGFGKGLGFKFSLIGGADEKIKMSSVGYHECFRLTEYGGKYHENRCIEEGNFIAKETITYNRFHERPKDKIGLIYQKQHKKSLHFENEYFEIKLSHLHLLNSFLKNHLSLVVNNLLADNFQKKNTNLTQFIQPSITQSRKRFYQEAKEEFKKKSVQFKNKSLSQKKLTSTKSFKVIQKNQDANKEEKPIFAKFNQHENSEKMIKNERSISKNKYCYRLVDKSKKRSNGKLCEIGSSKEIKYLKDYRPSIREVGSKDQVERSLSKNSKSTSNLVRIKQMKQLHKYEAQIENEILIRREIKQKQLQSQYEKSMNALNLIQNMNHRNEGNYRMEQQYEKSKAIAITPNFQHQHLQNGCTTFQDPLEEKRQRLLREFKCLNHEASHSHNPSQSHNPRSFQGLNKSGKTDKIMDPSSIFTDFSSSRWKVVEVGKENRLSVQQFNHKYQDYLQDEKLKLSNIYYRKEDDFGIRQSAMKRNGQSAMKISGVSGGRQVILPGNDDLGCRKHAIEYGDNKNARYEYFFDKGEF